MQIFNSNIVFFCNILLFCPDAAPVYQYLAPRAGYVPVYIRFGDTPLSDINPELDEAFHEGNIRPMEVATNDQVRIVIRDA